MADIIINGPEGQSTINNIPAWATEATMTNISKTLTGIGKNTSMTDATLKLMLRGYRELTEATNEGDEEIQKLLKKMAGEDKKSHKEEKKANDTLSKGLKALQEVQAGGLDELSKLNSNSIKESEKLDKILKDLGNSSSGMMSFASLGGKSFGLLGMALGGVTKILGTFGLVILSAAKYIGNEFLDVFKIYNNSLSAGTGGILGLTHSVDNVATSANLAGMSLEEFGDFAQQNSKILRTLSARGFADLYTRSLLVQGGFLDIGMTADDAVESMMSELEYRRRFGLVINSETPHLQQSLIRSTKALRQYANAVGMSEADLRAQSEIQEDNVDQLRLVGMALGASETQIIDDAQEISRQLGAYSMQDLINPMFDAIAKGSVGLSDEMTQLATIFPDLFTVIDKEAHNFRETGRLNANLGHELASLFRDMDDIEISQLRGLVEAGVPAATAISNMQKQVEKISEKQFKEMRKELDESRLTLQNTFNRLGFVVNQGTASIGDFGKTAMLSALGFSRGADKLYDFNDGIINLSDGITEFVGNLIGENNVLYAGFESFNEYIKNMFSGQGEDESLEDYNKRLDDARTNFVGSINKMAEKFGDSINSELNAGTLAQTIANFFQSFIDQLKISIYESTGIDMGVSDIYTRSVIAGNMGMDQFVKYVGDVSTGDREIISDQIFKDPIQQEADRLMINRDMSYGATNNKTIQDLMASGSGSEYRQAFNAFLEDADAQTGGEFTGLFAKYFKSTSSGVKAIDMADIDGGTVEERNQLMAVLEGRLEQVRDFNDKSMRELITMTQLAENNQIDVEYTVEDLLQKIKNGQNVLGLAEGQKVLTDVDEDLKDMSHEVREAYKRFFRQVTNEAGIDYNGEAPGMATARMMNELYTKEGTRLFASTNSFGKLDPNTANERMSTYINPKTQVSVTAGAEFNRLKADYTKAMSDNFMSYEEKNALMAIANDLGNSRKFTLSDDDSLLLTDIKALILSNKEVSDKLGNATRAINNDNST